MYAMTQVYEHLKTLKKAVKSGDLAELALGAGLVLIIMGVVIFMLDMTSTITAVNNTSDYYATSAQIPTYASRTFQVLFFALVIVILGVGIAAIRGFGRGGGQSGLA